jgi:hypothetical protein
MEAEDFLQGRQLEFTVVIAFSFCFRLFERDLIVLGAFCGRQGRRLEWAKVF